MEKTVFTSKSAEVKSLVLQFIGAGTEAVSRNEIVKYVQENVSSDVTDGVIAGSIKMLTSAGEIIPVQRGIYVKGCGKVKATSFEKIANLCKRFQLDLERACTLNILELTDHEKEVYPDFIRNLSQLRNDVQLGTSCLESLVEDVRDAEFVDREISPIPDFINLEEKSFADTAESSSELQEESEVSESIEEKAERNPGMENEMTESSEATGTEENENTSDNAGRKRNRRNRH